MDKENRILIVEDDHDISNITYIHLSNSGYAADVAYSLKEATHLLGKRNYALILLDIMLPDGEGFALCREIRRNCRCPIIFVSCIGDGDSIISALRLGGDDYMTKPVDYRELIARIDANIRRATVYDGARIAPAQLRERNARLKRFTIDWMRRRAHRDGVDIDLTPIEYSILEYLYANSGELVLYSELYRTIWGPDGVEDMRTLTVHVSNLRKKIDPDHAGVIETVRNAGYIFLDV